MKVAVYGASGHTGRFVIAELLRRGHTPIAIGRDASKLASLRAAFGGAVDVRIASLDAAESLDRALAGADAVIHSAGPFLDTAQPLIEAALRSRVHYFDVSAEQENVLSTFARFDAAARDRGILVVPAAGFYGGLADVVATFAMSDWTQADRIDIAIALNRWWPTRGTRLTGRRNTAPRLRLSGGVLTPIPPPAPVSWTFPEPFATQNVVELPFTETILIARHLRVREMRNVLGEAVLGDLRDPATPEPVAADEHGRSDQHFVMEAVVRNGDEERRVTAQGRDIYAITAPIVVEAVERVCRDPQEAGAFALGELVDTGAFLHSLERRGALTVTGEGTARDRHYNEGEPYVCQ